MIRLPDPKKMQVKAMINESNIASVKEGMKARITLMRSPPNRLRERLPRSAIP